MTDEEKKKFLLEHFKGIQPLNKEESDIFNASVKLILDSEIELENIKYEHILQASRH